MKLYKVLFYWHIVKKQSAYISGLKTKIKQMQEWVKFNSHDDHCFYCGGDDGEHEVDCIMR